MILYYDFLLRLRVLIRELYICVSSCSSNDLCEFYYLSFVAVT